jgi:mono/diheme cytochrome c family protein
MYCIACHSDGKVSLYDEIFQRTIPAIMNPSFSKAIDNKYLGKMIKEGRTGTQMTAWKSDAAGLSDKEINMIIDYITKDRPEEKSEPFGFSGFKTDAEHGKELYEIRCALCHGIMARGGEGFLGIDLTNPVIQSADPEFLAITIRDGRGGTTMVPFGEKGLKLDDQAIADVVAYVRTLSTKKKEIRNEK